MLTWFLQATLFVKQNGEICIQEALVEQYIMKRRQKNQGIPSAIFECLAADCLLLCALLFKWKFRTNENRSNLIAAATPKSLVMMVLPIYYCGLRFDAGFRTFFLWFEMANNCSYIIRSIQLINFKRNFIYVYINLTVLNFGG